MILAYLSLNLLLFFANTRHHDRAHRRRLRVIMVVLSVWAALIALLAIR